MLHSQTSHGDIFTSASFPLLRRLRCWIMSWSQFNPLEADWWEWEVVYDETDGDGVISFEAAPTRSTSNGLPVIFSQLQFAKEIANMLGDGNTWAWTICPYTVPKPYRFVHCSLSLIHLKHKKLKF